MKNTRCFILSVLILSSCAVPTLAYYHPDEGRWLSRDPITERGGLNLYGFCLNAPTLFVDTLGDSILPSSGGSTTNNPVPPPPSSPPPAGECRVSVACFPIAVGQSHCFVIFEDSNGAQSACRGGNSRRRMGSNSSGGGRTPSHCNPCCGFWGTVVTECGTYGPGFVDYGVPGTVVTVISQGPQVCAARSCVQNQMGTGPTGISLIENGCIRYGVLGPNSNTALHDSFSRCGLPTTLPPGVSAPGWRDFSTDDANCHE
jgi:hypothetical protein